MRCVVPYSLSSWATTCKSSLNVSKVQYKLRVASGLNLPWYGNMEWNMEESFSMEWNWNGRKLPVWNMEKSSSVPFHTTPCTCTQESKLTFLTTCPTGKWYHVSACPWKFQLVRKKMHSKSFKAVYLWKKICKMYFLSETLNLRNKCILFRELSFCARLLW